MLTISEAQAEVFARALPLPALKTVLTPACLGMVLAEAIVADLDSPPFTKSLMDGYAVRAADLGQVPIDLEVIEEITAGTTPKHVVGKLQAARIMTGAPLPQGADCVVAVEQTEADGPERVRITQSAVRSGQHVMDRGLEMRAGEIVLAAGCRIRPQEMGLLAAVGRTEAQLFNRPRVAILPTGDELVEAARKPGLGQIRNSNGPMLAAQVLRAGGTPLVQGIARDTVESLRELISVGLGADILLLSGGVSAGKLDLVPGVLQELGVQAHFHKVRIKPGKPLFFGTKGSTLIFGLPGNPVSSLICFELFVRPAIARLMGDVQAQPATILARLKKEHRLKSDRPTYHPAVLTFEASGPVVDPGSWFGSADLRGLANSNAFVIFPPGEEVFAAGQTCEVLVVDDSSFSRQSATR
jgi:molybdopterin molybdotransferase